MINRKVSIVIPAYNEEESIKQLYDQIIDSIHVLENKELSNDYEIWFVNDGSSDQTESVMLSLCEYDTNVHMISFRKNFGKSPALQAAFRHVSG